MNMRTVCKGQLLPIEFTFPENKTFYNTGAATGTCDRDIRADRMNQEA